MWTTLIKFLSKNGLLLVIFGILTAFGTGLNALFPDWTILTNIFTIIRFFINSMDWIIPASTLLTVVALTLGLDLLEWALMAGLLPVDWFRKKAD